MPGHRRGRPQLPGLLRRDPHQHARLRRARDTRGRRAADRLGRRAHLDAVPDPQPGRAGREDRQAVRHPRRQGVLHQLRHRGQRDRAAAGHRRPARRTRCSRCGTATTAARSAPWRSPATTAGSPPRSPRSTCTTSTAPTGTCPPSPAWPTPPTSRPASRTCGTCWHRGHPADVACLIAEPIQGVGGFTMPPDGLFAAYKQVLDENGILFISDEVQTGWGRTGEHFWGIGAHGVTPDMMTFAKGAATGSRSAASSPAATSWTACAATASPRSAATPSPPPRPSHHRLPALPRPAARAARLGPNIIAGLRDAAPGAPPGRGQRQGPHVRHRDGRSGHRAPSPALATRMLEETRERGLLIGKGGLYGSRAADGSAADPVRPEARRGPGHPHRRAAS